ncbi:MAG: EF-hand-like protein [Rhodoferax sp.]|nr:EF-hand-like protein [Rhodoferax sp.]
MHLERLHPLVLLFTLLAAGAATAQTGQADRAQNLRAELQKRFAAADANGDGRLSRDEAREKMPRVYRNFDAIDAAHTGSVTLQQIAAFAAAQRGKAP